MKLEAVQENIRLWQFRQQLKRATTFIELDLNPDPEVARRRDGDYQVETRGNKRSRH